MTVRKLRGRTPGNRGEYQRREQTSASHFAKRKQLIGFTEHSRTLMLD